MLVNVLYNMHKKYARKNTTENQLAMAILRAGKLEHGYNQKLVSSLNRGGLLNITKYTQSNFLKPVSFWTIDFSKFCDFALQELLEVL